MRFKALLSDIDGTAVDSEPVIRQLIEELAKEGGFHIQFSHWDIFAGIGDRAIWEEIHNLHPDFKETFATAASFEEARLKRYEEYAGEIKPNVEVRDIFELFLENALAVTAVTNEVERVAVRNLEGAGYPVDQIVMVSKDDVVAEGCNIKPHPDPYLMALRDINEKRTPQGLGPIKYEECLVLEDSKTGARAGLAAGMVVVQITDNCDPLESDEIRSMIDRHGSEYHSTKLSDLPVIFKGLTANGCQQRPDLGLSLKMV